MKKKSKIKIKAPKVDPYLEGFMTKFVERLIRIENKMDTLLSRKDTGKQPSHSSQQPPLAPRHERQLYEAVCADCHKVCEVPFRPTEDRAVYCKECWGRRKQGSNQNPRP